jgi:hypothetical protein
MHFQKYLIFLFYADIWDQGQNLRQEIVLKKMIEIVFKVSWKRLFLGRVLRSVL